MKLSEVIREAQTRLVYNENSDFVVGETDKLSCNCVELVSDKHEKQYSDMLYEYDFLPGGSSILPMEILVLPEHERQFFRLHMMELMACIAEDEGN